MNSSTIDALTEQQDIREIAAECRRILHEIAAELELQRLRRAEPDSGINSMMYLRGRVVR